MKAKLTIAALAVASVVIIFVALWTWSPTIAGLALGALLMRIAFALDAELEPASHLEPDPFGRPETITPPRLRDRLAVAIFDRGSR